jgi:type VI secretion system protein VasI
MVRFPVLLAVLLVFSFACGVPKSEHESLVSELDRTKSDLEVATNRVGELESEVKRLRETDGGYWAQILSSKNERQWREVVSQIDVLLERWPQSPYVGEARKLRSEVVESQAAELLERARTEIAEESFEQAKSTLEMIGKEFPATRAHAQAGVEKRSLDSKIAAAKRRQIGNGAWSASSETSPIDDSQNVFLSLASEDAIHSRFGEPVRPLLYVRCKEKATQLFVVWDVYLGIDEAEVLHRLDNRPARTSAWNISTDHKATFYRGSSIGFARELLKHEKLLLQVTPYGEKPVMASFALAGLENAIVSLQEACGWK